MQRKSLDPSLSGKLNHSKVYGAAGAVATLFIIVIVVFAVLLFRSKRAFWDAELPSKTIDYHDYEWKSGDLLLCSSRKMLINRLLSATQWTHVGLVYVDSNTKHPYVWDIDSKSARLMPLYAFLDIFPGHVAVRPLERTDFSLENNVNDEAYKQFIKKMFGMPYTYDFWMHGYNRLFPLLKIPMPEKEDKTYFCCTLTADTLAHLGVLTYDSKFKKNHLSLRDFEYDEQLPMAPGWMYGKEILVKPPKEAKNIL